MKIDLIVGARPNYMKAAPIYRLLKELEKDFIPRLVHTGQHYDKNMSQLFFQELGLPEPDIYLGIGSGRHGEQTGKIMMAYEKVLLAERPDLVLVVGDVNSTMACSLVAVKLHVKTGHVEAGLRSHDWHMPEEINRVVTDRICDYLFTTCQEADENLKAEGIDGSRIFFVGNTMIDSLHHYLPRLDERQIQSDLHIKAGNYILVTLHRPSNVDEVEVLKGIFSTLGALSRRLPVIFPMHPRTRKMLGQFGVEELINKHEKLLVTEPLGYLDFMKLQKDARLVLTDSGGIQEETTVLGVPCLTLRKNTERAITIREGTNELIGPDPQKIETRAKAILEGEVKKGETPKFWDGKAAERIVDILKQAT